MTADRADGRGPMGEPSTMTATTNHEGQATGRPRAEGRPSEQAGLPGRWRALTVSLAAAFMTLLDVSIVYAPSKFARTGQAASVGSST